MPDSSMLCSFSRGMYITIINFPQQLIHNHQMNAAACSVPRWVILNQTRSSLIKVEANECCWWEGRILPHFSIPTWALNLQTASWDRYLSHEKICTTPSGNERKQKDLRIICFSIIMMLLKSMHLRHAADGSWVRNTMWNFLCVIMVQTHLKAALSNLCMQKIYILQRMVHCDKSGMFFH